MNRQNIILRCTINVEPDNQVELAFIRAALTRLNVLSAKTKPRDGLAFILDGRKLRGSLEESRIKQRDAKHTPVAVVDKPIRWAKTKLQVHTIFEKSMDIAGLGEEVDGGKKSEFLLDGGEIS